MMLVGRLMRGTWYFEACTWIAWAVEPLVDCEKFEDWNSSRQDTLLLILR